MVPRLPAMSLKVRIAVTIFCLEAVMVALVLFVTLRHSSEIARAELAAADRQVESLLQDLSRVALLTDEFGRIQAFIEETRVQSRLRYAALIDLSGMVVAASDPGAIGVRLPDRGARAGWPEPLIDIGSGEYRLGWLALDLTDESLSAAYRDATRLGVAVAAVGMVLIALVSVTMGHLLTRRLARLAAVADQVSDGVSGLRADLKGRDEVARVGRAFDAMIDRLETHLATVRLDRDRLILPTEAIHEGFALWGPDGRLVRCNARLRELLGSAGPLLTNGMSFRRFVRLEAGQVAAEREAGRAWIRDRLARHQVGAAGQEHGFRDGRWVRVSESRIEDGSVVSIYTDITEAKTRELALHESERRLRAIMDSVQEGIITLDSGWRTEAVNPAAATLFGYAPGGVGRRAFDELLRDDAAEEPGVTVPGEGRRRAHLVGQGAVELTGVRADGRRFPAEISVSELEGQERPAYIVTVRDVTSQKADRDLILFHATHDPLTGLPNRRLFDDRLGTALHHARRRGELAAVALLDLDRFKAINDSLGHGAGDELLVTLARRFAAKLRGSDTVARMGGDEFIFVLTSLHEAGDALKPAAKLLEAVRAPIRLQGHQLRLSASMGISLFPADGVEPEILLKHADAALYRAKARGRNRCELFDPTMTAHVAARAALESDLRRACKQDQLVLLYQPQINVQSGAVVGFEALMRWQHPRRGLLGPDAFIPLAEESGLIGPLGSWALHRACRDLAGWRLRSGGPVRMAVNISARQLQQEGLAEEVGQALASSGLAPAQLELEVNEGALLQEDEATVRALAQLRALGVGLALDDFGTGFSSLSHLRHYPIQRLKIDRSFVQGVARSRSDATVARHIIALAQELGLTVIAEGIETSEQLTLLRRFGCHEGQGYLLGRPVLAGDVPTLLATAA